MEFVKNLQSFFQSYNKSLINQACSGPYWENIGPRSFLYGPRCARSVLSRPRADILPVRPSRLVNKIYVCTFEVCALSCCKSLTLKVFQVQPDLEAATLCDVTDGVDTVDVTILTGQMKSSLPVPVHQIDISPAFYQHFYDIYLMCYHGKMEWGLQYQVLKCKQFAKKKKKKKKKQHSWGRCVLTA